MQKMQLEDSSLLSVTDDDDGNDSVHGVDDDDDEHYEFDINDIDGLQEEVLAGNYESILLSHAKVVWDLLLAQKCSSSKRIDKNVQIADNAWNYFGNNNDSLSN